MLYAVASVQRECLAIVSRDYVPDLGTIEMQPWRRHGGFSVGSSLICNCIMAPGAPIGALVASLISERLGRKWLLVVVALATVVYGLTCGLTFQLDLTVAADFLITVSIQCFAPLYAYIHELCPTEAKALNLAFTYGNRRLADIVEPLIICPFYESAGYSSAFVYMTTTRIVVALVVGVWGPLTHFRDSTRSSLGTEASGAAFIRAALRLTSLYSSKCCSADRFRANAGARRTLIAAVELPAACARRMGTTGGTIMRSETSCLVLLSNVHNLIPRIQG